MQRPAALLLTPLLAVIALMACAAPARADSLPPSVAQALHKAGIPDPSVSLFVQAVDAEQPILRHNAEKAMNPASVMKLVTAFAALDALGPARTWTTHISTNGAIEDGVLLGDLFITGNADPLLNHERIWKMLRQLRMLDIETIQGDIVLDDSVLRLPPHDPYLFDGRGLRPYNSGPYGLLLHFNTLSLLLIPATQTGLPTTVIPSPALSAVQIDNRITTSAGNCGIWYSRLDARIENNDAMPRIILSGTLPASCGVQNWGVAPLPAAQFSAELITAQWAELGGKLRGHVRHGGTPAQRTLLASNTSPALAEIVREMNKWSSNVIARQLLAILGAKDKTSTNMVASGAAAATEQLRLAGVDIDGLHIENGAGLSRSARIKADSLGNMLIAAWRKPFMPEFIAALPIAGIDGTARRNLGRNGARGQAHIKTGTINNVRAIGGYVQDHDGRRYAVVMMVNHPNANDSLNAQNALIDWVWQGAKAQ